LFKQAPVSAIVGPYCHLGFLFYRFLTEGEQTKRKMQFDGQPSG
jgi:hypothetical protein